MLETIREFAGERLDSSGEQEALERRIAAWVRSVAIEAGLRTAAAIWRFWQERGHLVEAETRLARLLELPEAQASGRAAGPCPRGSRRHPVLAVGVPGDATRLRGGRDDRPVAR